MRASEIREMTDHEIQERVEEAREELWNLRFKHATNQLNNSSDIKRVRKVMARLKTVQREREIWAEYEAAPEQQEE
ncbi:MAG: 50S ribosomal protein L29 [Ardenticatenaceae bacterium]